MENLKTDSNDSTAIPDIVSVPPTVGERLRAARERSGLSIAELARAMKLGVYQLEAMEQGHWAALPGPTFVRGFVRNYARQLNLDPQPLMVRLDAEIERPAEVLHVPASAESPVGYMPSNARRDRTMMLIGLALVVLATLLYTLLPSDLNGLRHELQQFVNGFSRQEEPPVAPAPTPAATPDPVFPPGVTAQQVMTPQALVPAEATGNPAVNAPQTPPAGVAQLDFTVDKASWIEVKDRDGRVVFSQKMTAGSVQKVEGLGPLSLVIGYAPGVRLSWRGQPVDLEPHTRGDVARLVLE